MNIDIVDNLENLQVFLNERLYQLQNFNSITIDDLKLLCYTIYKQNTVEKQKEIEPILLTILSYINNDTQVYTHSKKQVTESKDIFNGLVNNKLKQIFED